MTTPARIWCIVHTAGLSSPHLEQTPSLGATRALSLAVFSAMSLHRVSSMESWEHVRGSSPASLEHRKMSFNPVANWVPPEVHKESAVQVSKAKRIGKLWRNLSSGSC